MRGRIYYRLSRSKWLTCTDFKDSKVGGRHLKAYSINFIDRHTDMTNFATLVTDLGGNDTLYPYEGGYCGIQERAPGHEKNAIFSLWHDDESGHNVELIQKGPGTTVEPFGGEGTGLKCTLPFDWKVSFSYHFVVNLRLSKMGMQSQS